MTTKDCQPRCHSSTRDRTNKREHLRCSSTFCSHETEGFPLSAMLFNNLMMYSVLMLVRVMLWSRKYSLHSKFLLLAVLLIVVVSAPKKHSSFDRYRPLGQPLIRPATRAHVQMSATSHPFQQLVYFISTDICPPSDPKMHLLAKHTNVSIELFACSVYSQPDVNRRSVSECPEAVTRLNWVLGRKSRKIDALNSQNSRYTNLSSR